MVKVIGVVLALAHGVVHFGARDVDPGVNPLAFLAQGIEVDGVFLQGGLRGAGGDVGGVFRVGYLLVGVEHVHTSGDGTSQADHDDRAQRNYYRSPLLRAGVGHEGRIFLVLVG